MHWQVPFVEGNPYTTDPALPGLLKRILPPDVYRDVSVDIERFGGEVLTSKPLRGIPVVCSADADSACVQRCGR